MWGAKLDAELTSLPVQRQTYIRGTDELAYPALEDRERQKRYVEAKASAILAVNLGNYEEIPNLDPETGKYNFDILCDACGNREDDLCSLKEKIIAAKGEEGIIDNSSLEFRSRW
jgi:hypothetical protein